MQSAMRLFAQHLSIRLSSQGVLTADEAALRFSILSKNQGEAGNVLGADLAGLMVEITQAVEARKTAA